MSVLCRLGLHAIPNNVDEPGYYACRRCGRREFRVDWKNIEVSPNGTVTRTNMGEVVSRYLRKQRKEN